jgi:hypothetical protein
MVERLDGLDVTAVGQREHEVARAERRVDATVGEPGAEPRTQTLDAGRQAFGTRGVTEVVEPHAHIVTDPVPGTARGAGGRDAHTAC